MDYTEILQDILFTLQCILVLNVIKDIRHHIQSLRRKYKWMKYIIQFLTDL